MLYFSRSYARETWIGMKRNADEVLCKDQPCIIEYSDGDPFVYDGSWMGEKFENSQRHFQCYRVDAGGTIYSKNCNNHGSVNVLCQSKCPMEIPEGAVHKKQSIFKTN